MDTTHAPTIARAKILQTAYFFGLGAGIPFITLYLKYALRTPDGEPANSLIGILFFIQSIVIIVSSPVAGVLGDLFKAHHRVISFYSIFVAAGAVVMAIPGIPGVSLSLSTAFILFLIGITINGLFSRPLLPLIDTETLLALHVRHGNADGYGSVRQYGSAAWVVSASLFGFILWITDQIVLAIAGYGLIYLILGLFAWSAGQSRPQKTALPWHYLKKDGRYAKLLLFSFIASFPITGSYQYTSYFMDDLHISFLFIGLAMGLSALPEIPLFRLSQKIIVRFGSEATLLAGTILLIIKILGFFLLPPSAPPAYFLAIQFMHGFGWALFYSGQVRLIDSLAHPDLRGTYQNLYTIPWTLSNALAGLLSAWIIEALGSRAMMGIHAGLLAAATVYFILFIMRKRRGIAGTGGQPPAVPV